MADKIYVGYEKWTSKSGRSGYNLHFLEEVESGAGNREYLTFDRNAAAYRYNSCTEETFEEIFKGMKFGQKVKELYRGDYGRIVGCKM